MTTLTASEAAAEIARGTISAEDYTAACLDRIAALDDEVHAFIHLDPGHAGTRYTDHDRTGPNKRLPGRAHHARAAARKGQLP